MKRFMAMLLMVTMCFLSMMPTFVVSANSEAAATYTFTAVEGTPGETVDVKINFKTTEAASIAGVGPITYDSNVLEFVGFSWDASVDSLINKTLSSFDESTMVMVALFNEDNTYDVCLGTLQFKIKEGAAAGDAVISGTPSTKKSDTTDVASSLFDGKVTIPAPAAYTLTSTSGLRGSNVDVKINFKTTEAASIAGVGPITYDSNVLEFVGFSWDASVDSLINKTLSSFDESTMVMVALFNEDNTYDVCLGTLQFKIKEDAVFGDVVISGTPSTKKSDTTDVASSLVNATISVVDKEPEEIPSAYLPELEPQTATYYGDYCKYPEPELSQEAKDAGVTLKGIVYTPEGSEETTTEPTDAGVYTATITLGGNGWIDKELTSTLTIEKAVATGLSESYDQTFDANAGLTDAAALKAAMNLPATVDATYGADSVESDVEITWADATEEWNVKGGTYTYIGTPVSNNLDFTDVEIKATATVNPVVGTFATALPSPAVKKAVVLDDNVIGLADLDLPIEITVTYGDDAAVGPLPIVWSKTIEEIKTAAEAVTEESGDVTVDIEIEESTFADYEWLTINPEDMKTAITITFKDPATITFAIAEANRTIVYGTPGFTFEAPTWEPNGEGEAIGEVKVTYKGRGETTYAESEEVPTDAGTYTVTAALVSDMYAATPVAIPVEITPAELAGTLTLALEEDVITATIEGAADGSYDIVWYVGEDESENEGTTYAVTEAELGKVITAKLVAKNANYTGEIEAAEAVLVPAKAPEVLEIKTVTTATSITATITAKANGAEIDVIKLDLLDSEGNPVDGKYIEIEADENGEYKHKFTELENGATYTVKAIAHNEVGDGEALTKEVVAKSTISRPGTSTSTSVKVETSTGSGSGSGSGSSDTTDTSATEAVVESKNDSVTVGDKVLADKETANVTVETEDGVKVETTTDIKDKNVDSLTVTAQGADVAVNGDASEIIVEPIKIGVEAKGGEEAVDVTTTVAIEAKEAGYAYAVDALGNLTRIDSTYDAEAGKIVISDVVNGTVVAVSTKAPVKFADVAGRWSETEIHKAADLGLVSGKGEGQFDPSSKLTRSEAFKLQKNFADAVKATLAEDLTVKVDTEGWAQESDLWAARTGITTGIGINEDGEVIVNGTANITRQDLITATARLIMSILGEEFVAEGEAVVFADADAIAEYAAEAIELLAKLGIVKGTETANGVVANPANDITREEAAAIFNRAYAVVSALIVK